MMHIRVRRAHRRWSIKHDLDSTANDNPNETNEQPSNGTLSLQKPHSTNLDSLTVLSKSNSRSDEPNTKPRQRRRRSTSIRVPRISHTSSIISSAEDITPLHTFLPARFSGSDWQAVYSTTRDGISLQTLYSRCAGPNPVVILIRDGGGAVFGCYSSVGWKVSKHYYGTGETFVFTMHPKFAVYPWARGNKFFQLGSNDSLAVGGGGKFALFLDSMLDRGSSGLCATYGSPCLASSDQFNIVVLEAYSLVSPSMLKMEE